MNDERERLELEQRVHRELRSLPDLQAPETLLHRVMLSVHQRARQPWWRRSWLRWPLWARGVSLVVMVACAVALSAVVTTALEQIGGVQLGGRLEAWVDTVRPAYDLLAALGGAVVTLVRALGQPFWLAAFGLVAFAYVTLIALGTVCVRLAGTRA